MTDYLTAPILSDVLRRESRSLLQYVDEAFPWTPPEEQATWDQLTKLIAEERKALTALAHFLDRRRIPLPYLGSFPDFTGVNFVSLDHLLPLLVEHQKKSIASLESDLARLSDPEAAKVLGQLLEVERRHLKTLETLAARHTQTTSK
jgi:rubrerythrin